MINELSKKEFSFSFNIEKMSLEGERKILGGERVKDELSLSLSTPCPGYNIYISGDDLDIILKLVKNTIKTLRLDCPVIFEKFPSLSTLFGNNNGSFYKAEEGILILEAKNIYDNKPLFKSLLEHLNSFSVQNNEFIKEKLPKIILIGNEELYEKITEENDTFLNYFKCSSQMEYSVKVNEENIKETVLDLKEFGRDFIKQDNSSYEELLRYSSRYVEDRNELTTHISFLEDILSEANYIAYRDGEDIITKKTIKKAIKERKYREGGEEEEILEEIKSGRLSVSFSGMKKGRVNALAVLDRGLYSFGTPCVVSSEVAPGNEGIVNIEREAGLSGNIHDKGLLILESYLRSHYASDFPLSLYAGIYFEQNYGQIDGDSASAAELYTLLSAIGDFPLRQDIAVTGSVNGEGEIMVVGGINEKIEGFYNACSSLALTGTQGVIIPKGNISSLILSEEIENEIEKGNFHIWAIENINEGLELLSSLPRGEKNRKGDFLPLDSFNRRIQNGLKEICRLSQNSK